MHVFFSISVESKRKREDDLNQEPEPKKPCTETSTTDDFTLPPFSQDNPIGKMLQV